MNTSHILLGEWTVAVGVLSWGALKQKQVPWPGTVVRSGVAFGLLGVVSLGAPELSVIIGAGFLLALLLKVNWAQRFGASPPEVKDPSFPYHVLTFG